MNSLKVIPFNRTWTVLKNAMEDYEQYFFYEVVAIDDNIGRTMQLHKNGVFTNGKNYNPRFNIHWFPSCRCHWNVLLPLFMLNSGVSGKYAVITNDKHSAIINTETNEIYDPTYMANKSNCTLEMFADGYKIQTLVIHAANVDSGIFERLMEFLPEEEKKIAVSHIEAHILTLDPALLAKVRGVEDKPKVEELL